MKKIFHTSTFVRFLPHALSLILFTFFLVTTGFSQSVVTTMTNPNSTGFWDSNILTLFDEIKSALSNNNALFLPTAKSIATILALIYLSVRAYAMLLGEGSIQIMPLLRPFVITLVIINFGAYCNIIGAIGSGATSAIEAKVEANGEQINLDAASRDTAEQSLLNAIDANSEAIQNSMAVQDKTTDNYQPSADTTLSTLYSGSLTNSIDNFGYMLESYFQYYVKLFWMRLVLTIDDIIADIALAIFKGVAFCMFFITLILMYVLQILGPLSFAFSIAGPFSGSWVEWTRRYIAVSFYPVITYIVINISLAVIDYGLKLEADSISQITSQTPQQLIAAMDAIISKGYNFLGIIIIAVLATVGGLLQIPVMTSWVLGGGNGEGVLFNTAKTIGASGARGAAKTISGGSSAGIGAASQIGKSSGSNYASVNVASNSGSSTSNTSSLAGGTIGKRLPES
jgi:hypothetical protein